MWIFRRVLNLAHFGQAPYLDFHECSRLFALILIGGGPTSTLTWLNSSSVYYHTPPIKAMNSWRVIKLNLTSLVVSTIYTIGRDNEISFSIDSAILNLSMMPIEPFVDIVVCCRRQPKIKPILLKIYVAVWVRIVPTESI